MSNLLCITLALTLVLPPLAYAEQATEQIHQAAVQWCDDASSRVDQIKAAAEAVADKLLDGGRLFTAGNIGFKEEMFFRVGGVPFLKMWNGSGHKPKDVFFYGLLRPNDSVPNYERLSTLLVGGRFTNNVCIVFASRKWPQVAGLLDAVPPENYANRIFFIDTNAPTPDGSMQSTCIAQIATIATAFAFQGEVIAAATRKGKQLATYASGYEKTPDQTDESVQNLIVNPKYNTAPIEAGKLGREYLKSCRDQLASFPATQAAKVREAAERMSKCMKQGGMVWAVMHGHVHQGGTLTPPELPIHNFGREFEWDKNYLPKLPKKDMLVWLGYVEYPENEVKGALERGCEVVAISCDEGTVREGVTHIRLPIDRLDACVSIPGYPIRLLPTSGVIQSTLWYSLMAETKQCTPLCP